MSDGLPRFVVETHVTEQELSETTTPVGERSTSIFVPENPDWLKMFYDGNGLDITIAHSDYPGYAFMQIGPGYMTADPPDTQNALSFYISLTSLKALYESAGLAIHSLEANK